MTISKLKKAIPIWPITCALVLAACIPANQAPASGTISPDPVLQTPVASTPTLQPGVTPSLVTETVQCPEELVLPTITEVQPAQSAPGSEIHIIGSGGYVQDACGGYNESARTFTLYLDNQPAGELLCYVNHCEGKTTLSSTTTPGTHCLSVQKDECEFEFNVAAE